MELLFILAVVLIAVVAGLKRRPGQAVGYAAPPYQTKSPFFSAAERSFFGVLQQAVGDKFVVRGNVRVADVLAPRAGMNRSEWRTAFNRIASNHFDYVLCDP